MIPFRPFQKLNGAFLGQDNSPLEIFNIKLEDLVTLHQVHGDQIHEIRNAGQIPNIQNAEGDAVISEVPGVPIAVKTADCVPILIAHPLGIVAAVHAGWRGTQQRLLKKTLQKLTEEYRLNIRDIHLAIGPAICKNCYEVGEEVAQFFQPPGFKDVLKKKSGGKYSLDLSEANRQMALQMGVLPEKLQVHAQCNFKDDRYFSQRRVQAEGRQNTGRNYSWVKLSLDVLGSSTGT